jgi:hypothetical protein
VNSRHKLASFKKETAPLLELVTNDIYLESIWLGTMSMLEDIAAKYIFSNISKATPAIALSEIYEHIEDEQRHARLLEEMRPVLFYPESKYYAIEAEWRKIGHEFIMAFFNSPLLREANHRHAAYVHGAQTIERFPFRIYSRYLSMSKLSKVHEMLPPIIEEEFGHIELGQKLYAQLSPNERMPLSRLYQLEEQLCLMMLKRMNLVLRQHLNLHSPKLCSALELKITQDSDFEIAWNYALSCGEKCFSFHRANHLKEANTLLRASLRGKPGYRELEKNLVDILTKYILKSLEAGISESTIQDRFNNHYQRMIYNTNNIPLHYAYFLILENHSLENIKSNEKQLEEKLWAELILEISKADDYENSLSLSRA